MLFDSDPDFYEEPVERVMHEIRLARFGGFEPAATCKKNVALKNRRSGRSD